MRLSRLLRRFFPLFLACLAGAAGAQARSDTPALYVEAGGASERTDIASIGATLPWQGWKGSIWGGQWSGHWDVSFSRWSYDAAAGANDHLSALSVVPVLRWHAREGSSPWFAQAGIGAWVSNRRYHSVGREFSTRFNFATHLGLGVRLGAARRHEVLLRVQHISNAHIKSPNPGQNMLHLRYALHF